MVFPFAWMLSTALKPASQVFARPPVLIPNPPAWENFVNIFFPDRLYEAAQYSVLDLPILLKNTVVIAVLSTIGSVLSASFVAYGFARLRFPGRDLLFGILLSTMMVPLMVRMVPLFILYRDLGWLDTFYPLTVPAFLGMPFDIFLVRQFYRTIPSEYADAGRIDGCSELGIWWRIMVPMSKPVLTVVAVRAFQQAWGDFTLPLIILRSPEKKTLMLGLYNLMNVAEIAYNYQMAVAVITVVPMIILFFVFQNYFMQGISLSGLKG
jgi:ABC-type glycerol-3-phosphate transport system permease component